MDPDAAHPKSDLPLRRRVELRAEIEELYADYTACLDEGPLERWPEFFTKDCTYRIVPRENHDLGLPIALVSCESRDMLRDRVTAVLRTSTYAPRSMRHIVSGLQVTVPSPDTLSVQANYVVLETLVDELTRVFQSGRYFDRLVHDGRWRFAEKLCVFDSVLVPNSLVYPI